MEIDLDNRQLAAIGEVVDLAQRLNVRVWLRGGWAMDFFLGEVTRPHTDIDWFAYHDEAPQLATALIEHGYTLAPEPPSRVQQLDLSRDDVEHSFALLATDSTGRPVVAGGPWAGSPWPHGMLAGPSPILAGIRCPVVEPHAQIEIKQMMPVWVPGRPRRPKDAADIARLQAALK
ncbi:nucleotidyltransferase domain-containing protein [Actinoplanes aureus]|uniref:Aminoglycoside adenylyltransferase n=1 Tax=Actinoplanes aureus TaxID=2792083 RepID=A0A931C9W1_9ACTN|nr:aminoglycoside adenylyltransferase [Actinoplanes aureus]MBG0560995.1 aminoglycoside adenylyltransferase [Actinoplanes aureus]